MEHTCVQFSLNKNVWKNVSIPDKSVGEFSDLNSICSNVSTTLSVKDSITVNTRTQSLLVNNAEIILVQKKNMETILKQTNLFQKDPVSLHSVHTDNLVGVSGL